MIGHFKNKVTMLNVPFVFLLLLDFVCLGGFVGFFLFCVVWVFCFGFSFGNQQIHGNYLPLTLSNLLHFV